MHYVYSITFGRNQDSVPLSETHWQDFITLVQSVLASDAPGSWSETHTGTGYYEGVAEDSAVVSLIMPEPLHGLAISGIRTACEDLAYAYNQECVAFTVGTSELIYAKG